jgi:hypothetical protein
MKPSNGMHPSNELVIRTGPGAAKIALGIAGILLWMLMLTVLLAEIASGPKATRSSAAAAVEARGRPAVIAGAQRAG